MSAEELERLFTLGEIRKHVTKLRPELEEAGVTDLWHLEEAERLLVEMFSAPAALDFRDKSLSFQWHIAFLMAEYNNFKKESS